MDLPTRRERLERAAAAGRSDAQRELDQDTAAARAAAREELEAFEARLERVESAVENVGGMLRAVGATAALAFVASGADQYTPQDAAVILGGPSPLATPPTPAPAEPATPPVPAYTDEDDTGGGGEEEEGDEIELAPDDTGGDPEPEGDEIEGGAVRRVDLA
jgi:hypothetical protein